MRIGSKKMCGLLAMVVFVAVVSIPAAADEGHSAPAASEGAEDERPSDGDASRPVVLEGYVETFYQWNTNRPANGITNYRGFDNRHNTFTIANVALGARVDHRGFFGRLILQVGHTPSTYYLTEPERPGTEATNATGTELWKYVQEANAGYRLPVGGGLSLAAGLFLSPIGPETIPMHDNWNLSRSNLFFALPFYHTGVRATYALDPRWAITIAAYNGWNSVVDNNAEKSFSVAAAYRTDRVTWNVLYFGGVERDRGAPEGRAYRHTFDTFATVRLTSFLWMRGHLDGGFEPNRFGKSAWIAGALYVRAEVAPRLFVAIRGDAFGERAASNELGTASRIFWPASWVASGTGTLEYAPLEHLSLRLEYRLDHAASAMYFGRQLVGDGIGVPFEPTRRSQNTIAIGGSAFF